MASFEIVGSVTNSFGSRSAVSQVAEGQDQARTIANGVISTVNGHLNSLSSTGGAALSTAVSAISALAAFRPTSISVNYTPPQFVRAPYTISNAFTPTVGSSTINNPPSITFRGSTTDVNIPDIGGTPPVLGDVTIGEAPLVQTVGGAPVAPTPTPITVPAAPSLPVVADLILPELQLPTLKDLDLPTFNAPVLPVYQPVAGTELPSPPVLDSYVEVPSYQAQFEINENPELLPTATLVGPEIIEREVRNAVEFLRSRGIELSNELEASQTEYARESAELANADERRRFSIDQFLRDVEVQRAVLVLIAQHDGILVNAAIALARSAFEAEMLKAEAQLDTVRAMTQLYNARVAAYTTESELYRVEVEARLSELDKYRAQVEAEVAKTRANAQVSQNYAQAIAALAGKADAYNAQVQALLTNVEANKAQMQAVAVEADVARTQLSVYGTEVDAYIAGLAGYKTQFEVYAAQTRGVAAQNSLEQARTQVSVANTAAAGARIANAVTRLELDAENLRLQAVKLGASYEETKLKNTVEQIRAQIAGDLGRTRIQEWAANAQLVDSKNEAIIDNAQAAVRYYTSASDSAQRAADQTLRAVTSATQAAATAQETAGRAAASLAQGAYSAVHVSASLQGGGRISASEERNDRVAYSFQDMLNYTEQRLRSLAA